MSEDKLKLLAAKLRAALLRKNMRQTEFAELMGVSTPMISRWLSGTNNFSVSTLLKIERALDIQLIDLEMRFNPDIESVPTSYQ